MTRSAAAGQPQARDQPAARAAAADAAAVDRFLARHEVPIVEGDRCTFLYRGEADAVLLVHRIFGLPDHLPLRRVRGTDLWYVVLELPEGSRVEYQLEVRPGRAARADQRPAEPPASRTARSAVPRSATRTATRYRTGRFLTRRPGPGR